MDLPAAHAQDATLATRCPNPILVGHLAERHVVDARAAEIAVPVPVADTHSDASVTPADPLLSANDPPSVDQNAHNLLTAVCQARDPRAGRGETLSLGR